MSEVNVQIQNPNTSVNITEPEIIIQIAENSIEVVLEEGQPISIQVQSPVIEVNMGCCTSGGNNSAGHIIQEEGVSLAARAKLNFIGAGVTATDNPGDGSTDVTIPGGGGGASITDITYADMQTAITGGTLTEGAFYRITDAAGTDLGFVCQAIKTNEITVNGTGGYLNADFQAVGDYTGVEAVTGVAPGTQLGIWRTGFEVITIPYTNLSPDYIEYSTASGPLDDGETYTTDLGGSGTIIHDDGASIVTLIPSGALVAGEIITGDNSGNTVTVDTYTNPAFAVGDTITGGTTGATAVIVTDDGASSMTAYMTSAGVAFDGSESLDNGSGVTADMDGAAGSPTVVQGDVVIWNLLHWQLTDAAQLDGTNPATNTAAYTLLDKATYPETYITAWDVSEFDFLNNKITRRKDLRGNIAEGDNVSKFTFGNDLFVNNIMYSGGEIDQKNWIGVLQENIIYSGGSIKNCTGQTSSEIGGNTLNIGASIENITMGSDTYLGGNFLFRGAQAVNITLENNAAFQSNTLFISSICDGIVLGDGSNVANNILENGGSLTGITAGANCSISRNKIGQGATLGGSTTMGDGAAITDTTLANGYTLNVTLAAAEIIDGLNYGQTTEIDEATRDGLIAPAAGLLILNTDTSKLNFYTGAGWEAVTSS